MAAALSRTLSDADSGVFEEFAHDRPSYGGWAIGIERKEIKAGTSVPLKAADKGKAARRISLSSPE